MNQSLRQLIGTERHVLGILFCVVEGGQHHILVLIGGIVEIRRLDRTRYPLLGVGVGGGGHFLTAELVLTLRLRVLHPLVVFHGATDGDSLGADAELGIRERILGGGHCTSADEFAVE